jgi:hypothetical protein
MQLPKGAAGVLDRQATVLGGHMERGYEDEEEDEENEDEEPPVVREPDED